MGGWQTTGVAAVMTIGDTVEAVFRRCTFSDNISRGDIGAIEVVVLPLQTIANHDM